ncbi:MAG: hypothetical protein A3J38_03885 [Gammaproteobacteria bacterium RIFCSPHIGHO2_12_FULL_45_9]|nr:MAG: hypothetical protein A3J38_03885 [Gammaproteobacteria bacterium RIFCSPHIGHO2_12_FULL_45_9]
MTQHINDFYRFKHPLQRATYTLQLDDCDPAQLCLMITPIPAFRPLENFGATLFTTGTPTDSPLSQDSSETAEAPANLQRIQQYAIITVIRFLLQDIDGNAENIGCYTVDGQSAGLATLDNGLAFSPHIAHRHDQSLQTNAKSWIAETEIMNLTGNFDASATEPLSDDALNILTTFFSLTQPADFIKLFQTQPNTDIPSESNQRYWLVPQIISHITRFTDEQQQYFAQTVFETLFTLADHFLRTAWRAQLTALDSIGYPDTLCSEDVSSFVADTMEYISTHFETCRTATAHLRTNAGKADFLNSLADCTPTTLCIDKDVIRAGLEAALRSQSVTSYAVRTFQPIQFVEPRHIQPEKNALT